MKKYFENDSLEKWHISYNKYNEIQLLFPSALKQFCLQMFFILCNETAISLYLQYDTSAKQMLANTNKRTML